MMPTNRQSVDPLTRATVTVAWVILLNKPFYPLYIWYLVGNGVWASLGTLISLPLFLAIPLVARYRPLFARIALPLVGTLDTVFETKLFGQGSGTELFLAACILLAGLSFRADEKWWQRGIALYVFAAFLVTRCGLGSPLHIWADQDLATLLKLNGFAVASLTVFIVLRFAGTNSVAEPQLGSCSSTE